MINKILSLVPEYGRFTGDSGFMWTHTKRLLDYAPDILNMNPIYF